MSRKKVETRLKDQSPMYLIGLPISRSELDFLRMRVATMSMMRELDGKSKVDEVLERILAVANTLGLLEKKETKTPRRKKS